MLKLARKSANFPPHPAIPNAQNPWRIISEHETIESARMALEECLPTEMFVYGVLDADNKLVLED